MTPPSDVEIGSSLLLSMLGRSRCCERITRHFHEKAARCQAPVLLGRVSIKLDRRPAEGAGAPVFLSRFRAARMRPSADQRQAEWSPGSSLDLPTADSPYFHPHSSWSRCSGASWVSSIGNGCCILGAELNSAGSSDVVPGACRSHPNSASCFKSFQAAFFRFIRKL